MALKLSLWLGALSAGQLVVGLALQFTVLIAVGAGPNTDAFVAAQTVPLLLFGILAMPLQGFWLPRLSVIAHDFLQWKSAQGVAQGQLFLLLGAASVALALTAGWWVRLLFPGFDVAQRQLTVHIAQILLLAGILNGQTALLTISLRARERFIVPELVSLVVSLLAVIATFAVVPKYGVLGAAWVNAARSAVVSAILYGLAGRPPVSLITAAKDIALWRRIRPLFAGSSIYKCEPLIDRFLGSQSAAGGLTLLTLSQTGMGAMGQIVERSICMPVVPKLARMAEAKDYDGMRSLYRRCVWRVSFFALACLLLLLMAHPVWEFVMQRAFKISGDAAMQMWLICMMLLGFLHVSASGSVPVAAFYALGDTKTPVRLSIGSFILGIGLKVLFFYWLGLPGLALSTSVYYLANLVVVSIFLERRLNHAARQEYRT